MKTVTWMITIPSRHEGTKPGLLRRSTWGWLPALALSGLGMLVASCGNKTPAGATHAPRATVTAVTLKPAVYTISEEFPGTLEANTEVQLRPDVTGYLEAVKAADGSMVRRGQPLYDIDKTRYQAAYNQAAAALQQAQADLDQKQRDLKRYQDLLQHDAIAHQVAEQAGTAVKTAEANVAAAQAALHRAATDLNHATMRAPISGKLGILQVKVGDIINAGQTLINTLVNDDPMYADFSIPQSRIAEFTRHAGGSKDTWQYWLKLADSTQYASQGKLLMLDNKVDPSTGTIRVRLVFPNSHEVLKSGMSVVVVLRHPTDSSTLAVPTKALIQTLAETSVYTLGAGNVVAVKRIEPEAQLDSLTIVRGLQAGDRVVVEGLQQARPGDTVNVKETP
jgi:membrane fusion protein (multidrug efflux system)